MLSPLLLWVVELFILRRRFYALDLPPESSGKLLRFRVAASLTAECAIWWSREFNLEEAA
jgi:hypothetical protein